MRFKNKLYAFLAFICALASFFSIVSCSSQQSAIKNVTFLDLTSLDFPLFSNHEEKKLYIFAEIDEFKNFILTFENTIQGDNLDNQMVQFENSFKHYDFAMSFLLVGTFGTSDSLNFEYNNNEFVCNITIPNPSTEGLHNLFIALIVVDENISDDNDVNLVVNYNY